RGPRRPTARRTRPSATSPGGARRARPRRGRRAQPRRAAPGRRARWSAAAGRRSRARRGRPRGRAGARPAPSSPGRPTMLSPAHGSAAGERRRPRRIPAPPPEAGCAPGHGDDTVGRPPDSDVRNRGGPDADEGDLQMTFSPPPPARRARVTAFSLAGVLAGTLALGAAAPAAAAPEEFASSFEAADPAPEEHRPHADPVNFTGDLFAGDSLLGLVEEVTGTGSSPANEGPANAADANPSSKWLTFASTGTLTYRLSEPASITSYT